MFSNIKFIVLITFLTISSQHSHAESSLEHETKNEPQYSLAAKCAALAPFGFLLWGFKALYGELMATMEPIGNVVAVDGEAEEQGDDEQPKSGMPQNRKKQQRKHQKRTTGTAINTGNGGGCMNTVVLRSNENLNDHLNIQVQSTFSVQYELTIDADTAKILESREAAKKVTTAKKRTMKVDASPKAIKQPETAETKQQKSTIERVKDCKISKPAPSNTQGKKPQFGRVISVKVEDNDILDGIVEKADENNFVNPSLGPWSVTTPHGSFEIEVENQSAEKSQFIQHTLNAQGERFVSRRVVVYWR